MGSVGGVLRWYNQYGYGVRVVSAVLVWCSGGINLGMK